MTDHHADFPFEEIRRADGNFFDTPSEAAAAGYDHDQIWSVVITDDMTDERVNGDGVRGRYETTTFTYGPIGHIVNLEGYVATKERHDTQTYYHDTHVWDDEEHWHPLEDDE